MTGHSEATAEQRAHERVKNFTDVMWHAAVFVIVNGLLWTLDLVQGGGLQWAFWPTIFWGIGLAFHVASYYLDESGLQSRRYQRYLAEEQAKEARRS